ncbi:MAG TPA: flagellar protein FlaG [Candidatus Ozemobacteraceae bacterium]|nr:flagellar protein FlaG [Candidatus Ozemobacteraceae bacterium]HQG26989.1 flagellar protein FlaG [Candidatus Ozemobacteraceae bacterium]
MEIGNVKPVTIQVPEVTKEPEVPLPIPGAGADSPMKQEAVKAQAEAEDPAKQMEKIKDAVDKLNKTSMIFDRSLKFRIHDATKEMMVSVIDVANDKVIREIPSQEALDLVAKMQEYLGIIFDKKA